jgi:hypothetical protein
LLQLARNRSVSRRALFAKLFSCMSNPFMLVHRFKVCFWVMVGLGHPSLLLHILCIPFLLVRISICRRSHDLERLNQVKSQISQCCCLHISSPSPPSTSRPIAPHRASSRLLAPPRASSPLLKVLTLKSYGRTMMNSGAKMRSWKPRPLSDASNGLRMAMKHSDEMPGMLRYYMLLYVICFIQWGSIGKLFKGNNSILTWPSRC